MKAIHRLIVTSATYQQSSKITPELDERDRYNRLLARGPRFRLGAEAVRNLTASYQRSLDDVRRWAQVSESADFPGLPPAVRGFQRAAQ